MRIAEISVQTGNLPAAIDVYDRLLRDYPKDIEILIRLGDALLQAGAAEEAIRTYDRALDEAPENTQALAGLGRANLFLYRPAMAAPYFEKSLLQDPGNIEAMTGYGISLDMAGDHGDARIHYLRALEIVPDSNKIRNNFALSYLLEGNYAATIKFLEKIAFTEQATPIIRQNLALAYGLSGNREAALRVGRMDLDQDVVENNLRFYELLRVMEDKDSIRRLLLEGQNRNSPAIRRAKG
jgi:Flp pilus assembly protein TadD